MAKELTQTEIKKILHSANKLFSEKCFDNVRMQDFFLYLRLNQFFYHCLLLFFNERKYASLLRIHGLLSYARNNRQKPRHTIKILLI